MKSRRRRGKHEQSTLVSGFVERFSGKICILENIFQFESTRSFSMIVQLHQLVAFC